MNPPLDMRIERVLISLRYAWERYPHLRFMQLVGNQIRRGEDGYYIDDDELVRRLWEYAEQRS